MLNIELYNFCTFNYTIPYFILCPYYTFNYIFFTLYLNTFNYTLYDLYLNYILL